MTYSDTSKTIDIGSVFCFQKLITYLISYDINKSIIAIEKKLNKKKERKNVLDQVNVVNE